jgi:type IV pilus assembly protein PilC
MISATVPIIQALRAIAKQTKNKPLQKVIDEVADDVDGGMRLSDALDKHDAFDNVFVNMVSAGETSGTLDAVLSYLADEIEKSYDLESKIKGAMIYPAFIVGGLLIVGVAMIVFVLPNMIGMLEGSGQALPLPTKILIWISNAFRNYYIFIALFLIGGVGGTYYFVKKTELGANVFDIVRLKFPVFGKLWQYIYVVRFAGTLSSLLSAGVSLTGALKITGEVVGNQKYKEAITETIAKVEDGYSMADILDKTKIFPSMVIQMIRVGEKTGKMSLVLEKLNDFYAREVRNIVSNLSSLLEPVIMVVIGIAVAGMVAAVLMPMYNMANAF